MKDEGIPSANAFAMQIEEMVWDKDLSYVDAVILWCESRGLEPEIAAGLVKKSAPLKSKIRHEAEGLKLVKGDGGAKLPGT